MSDNLLIFQLNGSSHRGEAIFFAVAGAVVLVQATVVLNIRVDPAARWEAWAGAMVGLGLGMLLLHFCYRRLQYARTDRVELGDELLSVTLRGRTVRVPFGEIVKILALDRWLVVQALTGETKVPLAHFGADEKRDSFIEELHARTADFSHRYGGPAPAFYVLVRK